MTVDLKRLEALMAETSDIPAGDARGGPAPKGKPKNKGGKAAEPPLRSAPCTEAEKRTMRTSLSTFAQVVKPLRLLDFFKMAKETEADKGTKKFKA